jgi:hypothetical protein
MLFTGDELAHFLADALQSSDGLPSRLADNIPVGKSDPAFGKLPTIVRGRIPLALLGRHSIHAYPICVVYCRSFENALKDKFSGTSGTAELVVESTVSSESLETITELSSALLLSIDQQLSDMRGEWAVGGYFAGKWNVTVDQIKTGGLQYLQTSTLVMPVDIKRF